MAHGVTTEEDRDGVVVRWSVPAAAAPPAVVRRSPARPRTLGAGALLVVAGFALLVTPMVMYGVPAGLTSAGEPVLVPMTPLLTGLVGAGLPALMAGIALVVAGSPRRVVEEDSPGRIRGQLRIDIRGVHLGSLRIPWEAMEGLQRVPGEGRVVVQHDGESHVIIEGVDGETAWAVEREIAARRPELAELDAEGLRVVRSLRGRD